MILGKSLLFRLVALISLGGILWALGGGYAAYRWAYRKDLHRSQSVLHGLAKTVESSAAIAAYTENEPLGWDVVGSLLNNSIVQSAQIDLHDRTLAAWNKREQNGDREPLRFPLVSPVQPGEIVGTLIIVASHEELVLRARARAKETAFLLVLQVLGTSVLGVILASWYVSRPIQRLSARLQKLQPGGVGRLLLPRLHREDAIGQMVHSMNTLLSATEHAFAAEREARAAVEAMERQYRKIFTTTSAGILVLEPNGRLINANPTFTRVVGRPLDELRQLDGLQFFTEIFSDAELVWSMVHESFLDGRTVAADLQIRRGEEEASWVHCMISVQGGDPAQGFIEGVLYDITDRKVREQEAQHLAFHDPLTGLQNRRGSMAVLERRIRGLSKGEHCVAMMLDLDGFKTVNDTYGHEAGDLVLIAVARALQKSIRHNCDVAGRLGGG